MYAQKNGLLNTDGWKRCKRYARREKVIGHMINQVRLKNFRNRPRYKYGFQVPRDYKEALELDRRNKNSKWKDAIDLELGQIMDY